MELLDQLRSRLSNPIQATDVGAGIKDFLPLPPVAESTLRAAEGLLGFPLPSLLAEIYLTVANGGIGPGYGLFRIHEEPRTGDLVETYHYLRVVDPKRPAWKWPQGLLPVFPHGCGMYECVDCTQPTAPMIWHNPDFLVRRRVDSSLAPLAASLADRLAAWLRGDNLLDAANHFLASR